MCQREATCWSKHKNSENSENTGYETVTVFVEQNESEGDGIILGGEDQADEGDNGEGESIWVVIKDEDESEVEEESDGNVMNIKRRSDGQPLQKNPRSNVAPPTPT